MSNKPNLTKSSGEHPEIKWELDSRHTHVLFKLAREAAEKQIQKYRMRLIELEHFDPQAQVYEPNTRTFDQFDHKTKQERIEELKRWARTYEAVAQFCLKMEAVVMHFEAEQFGQQVAEMFRREGG